MNYCLINKLAFERYTAATLLGGLSLFMTTTSWAYVLYSCPGAGSGGDLNDRGFYMPSYPGVTLDSATLKLIGPVAGTYQVSLTVRSGAYDGPVLGASTVTIGLSADSSAPVSTTFAFPSVTMPNGGTVCFILSVVSGPEAYVYYDLGGGCPEVIETEDTTPPLSTFRRDGVDLTLTGAPEVVYSCPGAGSAGDLNDRGFYIPSYPGVTLDSATLKLIGPVAGTYQVSLAVRSGAYDGPVLGASTVTIGLNADSSAPVSTTFPFPSVTMPNGGTVCFILSVVSGPEAYVYYDVGGGCPEVIETDDTTPPLSTFRRDGVDVIPQ